jgi:hypothetical protein
MILDKYHKPAFGSISSPCICASVFGLKLAHMYGYEILEE